MPELEDYNKKDNAWTFFLFSKTQKIIDMASEKKLYDLQNNNINKMQGILINII